ncbi:MAG: NCS2 family permease [Candidatus Staskawiczbacteria bacterium]|nr:NCS2 family permease [Candidatus Staskawiczbacteria bacterium]
MMQKIDNFFGISRLGSTFRIELFAGISTFLSLSYIFVVNPAILSASGIDTSVAFFATIFGSVVATLLMGLWARLPFALAPGLEMNAYFSYVVVGVLGFTWQGALGAVFWVGVLTFILSFTPLRTNIIKAIPDKLKSGLAASVGVFLMLIALKVSGLLAYEGIQVRGIGLLTSKEAYIFYVGLALVLMLRHFKVKGSVLLSIVGAAIFAHFIGVGQPIEPIKLSKDMFAGIFAFDLGVIFNPKIWSVIIILFILDFYGPIAKFIGLTRNTPIVDKDGNLPRMKEGLAVDGLGTMIGAATGTSNLITYVESAVGIGEGGRTGLVAVVVAILMSLFLFIVPLINLIPVAATTGALFFVGLTIFPNKKELKSYTWTDIIAVGLMILVTFWTFGLDKAMLSGFTAFIILFIVRGKWKELNPYLVGSTLLLLLSFLLS